MSTWSKGRSTLTHARISIADHARPYACRSEAPYCQLRRTECQEAIHRIFWDTLTRRYCVIVQFVPLPRGEASEEAGNDLVERAGDGWSKNRHRSARDAHLIAFETLFACACAATEAT